MPRNADARPLLTLGVVAHSRKENERRLPIHPMHFQRIGFCEITVECSP